MISHEVELVSKILLLFPMTRKNISIDEMSKKKEEESGWYWCDVRDLHDG